MKQKLFDCIDRESRSLTGLADQICDNPEIGLQEYQASKWLGDLLAGHGFRVDYGTGGLETAFRAEYVCGDGSGPAIGLLCEYDALEGIGHGCGHHLQGPCIAGAALAVKAVCTGLNYKLIIYGTPAEETLGGKITMLEQGCFHDIDLALMMHSSGSGTGVDDRTMAMSSYRVEFTGQGAHAAIAPEKGRSALDALLLTFQGLEFLREHVPDDVRMHYAIPEATGPANAVHAQAVGSFALRSFYREALDGVIARFRRIVEGAAMMTETAFSIEEEIAYDNAIPIPALRDILMDNARAINAPDIRPPREKTGSSDFGNVCHTVPGACIRVASDGPVKVQGHTKEAAALGKSPESHAALLFGAKILAGAVYDLLRDPSLLEKIKKEFQSASSQAR